MMKSRAKKLRSWIVVSLIAGAVAALAAGSSIAEARGRGGGGGGHGGGGHGGGGHGGGGHGGGGHGGGHAFRGGGARVSRGFSGARHVSAGRTRSVQSRGVARSAATGSERGTASSGVMANSISRGAGSSRVTARNVSAVQNALNTGRTGRALHTPGALHNPATRAAVTAGVAAAALHDRGGREGGRGGDRGGGWRHAHGGYGWVGPVFWPFAYYDLYDYALWGDGYDPTFWDYGYGDLYAGLFGTYGYDGLSGYASSLPGYAPAGGAAATATGGSSQAGLAEMCGDDSRDIAGLPTDRFRQAIAPNDEQSAALDDLATASQKAAQTIKASCPTDIALTAPTRLADMQKRIEAMQAAVATVQPALDKFYGLLTDEQKAKLNGLAADQQAAVAQKPAAAAQAQPTCDASQPGATDWPGALIESNVKPTDAQRASLTALQDSTAQAATILRTSCPSADIHTPPARMAAIATRLDAMDKAVTTVRPALDTFYNSLTDEQKAAFDAIGPRQAGTTTASAADDESPVTRHHRHRHGVSVGGMIRRMIGL